MDQSVANTFWRRVLREGGSELIVAATYLLAWLFSAWLSDETLLSMVVAVALQFWVFTALIGLVTPRGVRGITWFLVLHAMLFMLLVWVASEGGQDEPSWWAVLVAQAPIIMRNLSRLARPPDLQSRWMLEMMGPFLIILPVGLVTGLLVAVLPDLGLAGRVITFDHMDPLTSHELKWGLMGGVVYFSVYAMSRTWWEGNSDAFRRADVSPAMVWRWRDEYRRSRGR